jgi:hypothetical protein
MLGMLAWYCCFLLASLLASLHCKHLDTLVASWLVLIVALSGLGALQSPDPSEWCGGYYLMKTVIKTPSKVLPPSC